MILTPFPGDEVVDIGIESKATGKVARTDAGGQMQGERKASAGSSFSYNPGSSCKVSPGFKRSALDN